MNDRALPNQQCLQQVLEDCIDNFAELAACERLSGGANQETYRIVIRNTDGSERTLAMRRAAGGLVDGQQSINVGLATEAKLFQIAKQAAIPTPEIYRVFAPDDGLGDGFIMSWLDGETLGTRIVKAPELNEVRPLLAKQCGQILARIHTIDIKASGLDTELATITPSEFIQDTWADYRELDTPQPMIDYSARWLLENIPQQTRECLVHNDFRNGNLMINKTGIVGVLDWEIAHIGDPMRDLGWLCTNSWRFGR